jgi:DNA-binding transcriptional regulator YiaG
MQQCLSSCSDRPTVQLEGTALGTRHKQKVSEPIQTAFKAVTHSPSVVTLRQSLGLTRKTFSRLTGYSERAIAEWESGKEQSDSSRQRLTEIHRLRQSLLEVIPAEQVGIWLLEPNDALNGFKPLEVIERGEIDRIWKLLYTADRHDERSVA